MNIRQIVGTEIREARRRLRWAQNELAKKSGYDRSYISGIERGVENPSIEVLQNIADTLGIPIQKLFSAASTKTAPDDVRRKKSSTGARVDHKSLAVIGRHLQDCLFVFPDDLVDIPIHGIPPYKAGIDASRATAIINKALLNISALGEKTPDQIIQAKFDEWCQSIEHIAAEFLTLLGFSDLIYTDPGPRYSHMLSNYNEYMPIIGRIMRDIPRPAYLQTKRRTWVMPEWKQRLRNTKKIQRAYPARIHQIIQKYIDIIEYKPMYSAMDFHRMFENHIFEDQVILDNIHIFIEYMRLACRIAREMFEGQAHRSSATSPLLPPLCQEITGAFVTIYGTHIKLYDTEREDNGVTTQWARHIAQRSLERLQQYRASRKLDHIIPSTELLDDLERALTSIVTLAPSSLTRRLRAGFADWTRRQAQEPAFVP